ncbi:hypothetical protein BTO25_02490, partial [Bacillus sp. MB366]
DAEDAKRDLEEQKKQVLEFDQKMKVLEKKIKNDWDRLTKEEMRQLIEMFQADAERAGIFGEEQAKHFSEQILRRSHEMVRFMEEVQKSLTQMVEFNNQIYDVIREDIQNVGKFQDQCNIYLKQIADSMTYITQSMQHIQQVLHDNGT